MSQDWAVEKIVPGTSSPATDIVKLTNALLALKSNFFGASLPTTNLYAGMDVVLTNGTRWVRNAANDDWIAAGNVNLANFGFAPREGSASQVFSVGPAILPVHAPRASQLEQFRVIPVNGCCTIDQVNAGALITPTNNSYPIDNVLFNVSQASKLQTQQITTSLLTLNASHAIRLSVLAQYAAAATEGFFISFPIEGIDIANLQWGTANAKEVSLQFKARASVAGTYSGSIRNAATNRSYPFSFALLANTDTLVKIENIAGDTAGTWPAGEVTGMYITFDVGSNADRLGAAGAWAAANYIGVTGSTAFVNQVNGSTLDISDVLLNEGPFCVQFPRQRAADVLRDCQRYVEKIGYGDANSRYPIVAGVATGAGQALAAPVAFAVTKRAIPTSTDTGVSLANCTSSVDGMSRNGLRLTATSSAAGQVQATYTTGGILVQSRI